MSSPMHIQLGSALVLAVVLPVLRADENMGSACLLCSLLAATCKYGPTNCGLASSPVHVQLRSALALAMLLALHPTATPASGASILRGSQGRDLAMAARPALQAPEVHVSRQAACMHASLLSLGPYHSSMWGLAVAA